LQVCIANGLERLVTLRLRKPWRMRAKIPANGPRKIRREHRVKWQARRLHTFKAPQPARLPLQ